VGGGQHVPPHKPPDLRCKAKMKEQHEYLFVYAVFELVDIVISKLNVLVHLQSEHFLILFEFGT
jgi:hypothetical protein